MPESYEILSGCEKCGKSLKEIKDAYEGKKKITKDELLKRLRDAGLPTKIEG
ncbi:MAG: hypothetical protein QW703_01575 [Candidatus Aenigmatarchaeota archaeon]